MQSASVEMIPYLMRTVSSAGSRSRSRSFPDSEPDLELDKADPASTPDDDDDVDNEAVKGVFKSLTSTSVTNHTPPAHSCTLATAPGPNHLNNLG